MKNSTYFIMGSLAGGMMALGAAYIMNKDYADKKIKKTVKDAKNLIDKNMK